jgi:hypothetical protein
MNIRLFLVLTTTCSRPDIQYITHQSRKKRKKKKHKLAGSDCKKSCIKGGLQCRLHLQNQSFLQSALKLPHTLSNKFLSPPSRHTMFARFFAVAAVVALAAATPLALREDQCNTGDIQCCQSSSTVSTASSIRFYGFSWLCRLPSTIRRRRRWFMALCQSLLVSMPLLASTAALSLSSALALVPNAIRNQCAAATIITWVTTTDYLICLYLTEQFQNGLVNIGCTPINLWTFTGLLGFIILGSLQ